MPKLRKKLMIQFQENTQTDGRTDSWTAGQTDPTTGDPTSTTAVNLQLKMHETCKKSVYYICSFLRYSQF